MLLHTFVLHLTLLVLFLGYAAFSGAVIQFIFLGTIDFYSVTNTLE